MPKTGRNDPCPCGSGKKYKHCCLDKDQAAEFAPLLAKRAELEAQRADLRAYTEDERAAFLESQELDDASNIVVDLVHAGRLDEAERAARELLARYPEVTDGNMRLGMVYEARGQRREAADCYRKVIEIMRANPGDYDPEFETEYLELIAELDPPPAEG